MSSPAEIKGDARDDRLVRARALYEAEPTIPGAAALARLSAQTALSQLQEGNDRQAAEIALWRQMAGAGVQRDVRF